MNDEKENSAAGATRKVIFRLNIGIHLYLLYLNKVDLKGAPQRARCSDLVRRKVYLYFSSLRVSFRDGH